MFRFTIASISFATLLALAACGGSDCDADLCDTGLPPGGCPEDPSTFVGPLPEWCLQARPTGRSGQ